MREAIDIAISKRAATEKRIKDLVGLGRPIVSTTMQEHKLVAAGRRVYSLKGCKTFHDFLLRYLPTVLGAEWWKEQSKLEGEQRHILLKWHDIAIAHLKKMQKGLSGDEVATAKFNGALRGLMNLSYSLFLLENNAEIQDVLLTRLKNADPSSFHGAYYETYVASAFIKAGFSLTMEDESDGSISHCEFTATSKKTGKSFSVEAKSRYRAADHSGPPKLGVRAKLNKALKKDAPHTRAVFIDVNHPEHGSPENPPSWMFGALEELREAERLSTDSDPSAYVVATSHPFLFHLDQDDVGIAAFGEGFKIPGFKHDRQFGSIREAVDAREEHVDMHDLLGSMRTHNDIPSTFDGEYPEFAFSDEPDSDRMQIGAPHRVNFDDGSYEMGILEDACVNDTNGEVSCIVRMPSGKRVITHGMLSERELAAYKSHPETFFGAVKHVGGKPKDALDWFDFFYESYKDTPKEKLIEWMKGAFDEGALKDMSQSELAKRYCEGMAWSVLKKRKAA